MGIGERVLAALSRRPEEVESLLEVTSLDNALERPLALFPRFLEHIRERNVLDFGCGSGAQAVAIAKAGARAVLAVDINESGLECGRAAAAEAGVEATVRFATALAKQDLGAFDTVLSLNAMEHYDDPIAALRVMKRALRPGGVLLVTFCPPWFAPYGAHMHFFTRVPWVHLFFSESTVMRVRARYRNDGAQHYEDVEGGLNRMSIRKWEELLRQSGLIVQWQKYKTIKRVPIVASLPLVREVFINRVSCVLKGA